jgi:hypothetical protein
VRRIEEIDAMDKNALDILMITYNRPRMTALSLERLLGTCTAGMHLWIWHNSDGSEHTRSCDNAETLRVVSSYRTHPNVAAVEISGENMKLREPTNWFWKQSKAPFVSKVDDDCLLPMGWAEALIQAHNSAAELGIVGCWRFYDEDFIPSAAQRKIRAISGEHQIMMNCWVQGSGYVMKRAVFDCLGPLSPTESFTEYGIRAALAGWINGWYFPFIHEEHMDDPRSPYNDLPRESEAWLKRRPLSAIADDVRSLQEWTNRVQWMARSVQEASPDPRRYVGWRAGLHKGARRLKRSLGFQEPWRLP